MGIFDKVKDVVDKAKDAATSVAGKKERYPEIPSEFPLPGKEIPTSHTAPETPPAFPPIPPTMEAPKMQKEVLPSAPLATPSLEPHRLPAREIDSLAPPPAIPPGTRFPPPPEQFKEHTQTVSRDMLEVIKSKLETLQAKIEKIEHQLDVLLATMKPSGQKYY